MKNLSLTILFLLFLSLVVSAQEQNSLQEKYDNLLESTETYEQYKVIPRTSLNALWSEVKDSLNRQSRTINDLRSEVNSKQEQISALKASGEEVQAKLDESLTLNDTIYFLGIPFSKVGYHIMVWLIIVALAVLAVISYFMFMRSNRVTTKTRREFESLNAEFENHRNSAREKQAKLKRDLQTAVNKLNERR